jgi:hypothetical protein
MCSLLASKLASDGCALFHRVLLATSGHEQGRHRIPRPWLVCVNDPRRSRALCLRSEFSLLRQQSRIPLLLIQRHKANRRQTDVGSGSPKVREYLLNTRQSSPVGADGSCAHLITRPRDPWDGNSLPRASACADSSKHGIGHLLQRNAEMQQQQQQPKFPSPAV